MKHRLETMANSFGYEFISVLSLSYSMCFPHPIPYQIKWSLFRFFIRKKFPANFSSKICLHKPRTNYCCTNFNKNPNINSIRGFKEVIFLPIRIVCHEVLCIVFVKPFCTKCKDFPKFFDIALNDFSSSLMVNSLKYFLIFM